MQQKLKHESNGLYLYYDKIKYRVKRVTQIVDSIAIEYYVPEQIDPETNKPLYKTLIIQLEAEK